MISANYLISKIIYLILRWVDIYLVDFPPIYTTCFCVIYVLFYMKKLNWIFISTLIILGAGGVSADSNKSAIGDNKNQINIQNEIGENMKNGKTFVIWRDTITNPTEEVRNVDYSFYKEKFDINNPEHLRIMNEPTQEELNAFAEKLEAAANDKQLNNELNKLSIKML